MRPILRAAAVALAFAAGAAGSADAAGLNEDLSQNLKQIETVVVIYAENRSFDNLFGRFPGANGLQNASPTALVQRDRDGTPLQELPPICEAVMTHQLPPFSVYLLSSGRDATVKVRQIRCRCVTCVSCSTGTISGDHARCVRGVADRIRGGPHP